MGDGEEERGNEGKKVRGREEEIGKVEESGTGEGSEGKRQVRECGVEDARGRTG